MTDFAHTLINWYEKNKRDLPWRNTKNPYLIWLSEVILQQTRVVQGLPYFLRFAEKYPQLKQLAQATDDEVFRLWQGLGYYSRAKNMLHTARFLEQNYEGKFPNTYQELLKLKGIGKYTAAAIASFAFQERVAVLDGNVFRVLSRYFGIETPINTTKGQKEFEKLSQTLLPEKNADIYNQAIMEFGALQCTPQKPDCMYCPLQGTCFAFDTQKQHLLPVKLAKIKVKERFFAYVLLHFQGKIAMKKRNENDIWQNLYDFHLEELSDETSLNVWADKEFGNFGLSQKASNTYKHQLTHQKIYVKFFHFEIEQEKLGYLPKNLYFFDVEEIKKIPKPILIANYLQKEFF